jgi:hypothetical protein
MLVNLLNHKLFSGIFKLPFFVLFLAGMGLSLQAQAQTSKPKAKSQTKMRVSSLNTETGKLPQAKVDTKKAIQWKIGLGAQREQDAFSNQSLQTQFSVGLKADYELTNFMYLLVEPRGLFLNGNVQSPSATSPKSSQFEVVEASANLHNEKALELSLGALNQQKTSSSLLLGDLAFPAARTLGRYEFLPGNSFTLFAQYAVPTSATLSTNSKDFERTPSLTTAGWLSEGRMGSFVASTSGQYFEYKDIPSSVAGDSALLGNTTTSSSTSSTNDFVYLYRGYDVQLVSSLEFNPQLSIGVKGQWIRNLGAPSNLSDGYSAKVLSTYKTSTLGITPFYEYFRIAPDATIAYYNSSLYQTNRIGSMGGLSLQYKKLFTVSASGGIRDALFESAVQTRENFYTLKLETLYAPF